ncbi:MAG: host attachment protein [Myxococcota bacterium]
MMNTKQDSEHERKGVSSKKSSASPPAFKGVTENRSRLEIRPTEDGGFDVVVDGVVERHETFRWAVQPDMIEPFQFGPYRCREIFEVPEEALRALESFYSTTDEAPPWQWAQALFEDGLVDDHFALTPRGSRALKRSGKDSASVSSGGVVYGVLVVDAARARHFMLRAPDGVTTPTFDPLTEVGQTTRPDARARDSERLSESRPGLRQGGAPTSGHAVSDRRGSRRREDDRRFATRVAEEATQMWRKTNVSRAVVVAGPRMLGLLRTTLEEAQSGAPRWSTRELGRDLTRCTSAALHDQLAAQGCLPPRGRHPPFHPVPGLPV